MHFLVLLLVKRKTLVVNIFTKIKFGKDLPQSYRETGFVLKQCNEVQNWKDPVQ